MKKEREHRQLEEFYSRNTLDWNSTLEDRRRRREDQINESIRRSKATDTQWKGTLLPLEHKTEKYNQRREKRGDHYAKAPIARSIKITDTYSPASSSSSFRPTTSSTPVSYKSYELPQQRSTRSLDVPSGDYSRKSPLVSERSPYDNTSYQPKQVRQTRKNEESSESDSESERERGKESERERGKEREREREREREKERDTEREIEREIEREERRERDQLDTEPLDRDYGSHEDKENYEPQQTLSDRDENPPESYHFPINPEEDSSSEIIQSLPSDQRPPSDDLLKKLFQEQPPEIPPEEEIQTQEIRTGNDSPSSDELDIKSFEFVDDPTHEADNPSQT